VQPSYISVMNVFTQQTRYTVPLFQRPYVWKREDQWQPLWDDIRAVAERVLTSEGKPISSHFLGTVVLSQEPNSVFSLPRREVIDGQQRLTTLQLLLKAAEHALDAVRPVVAGDEEARKSVDIASRQIAPLTSNPAYADDDERYKVWPTNEDRKPFRDVMDSAAAKGPSMPETRMAQAYQYFRDEFKAWLGLGSYGERAKALASALKDHLRLIVLDLDAADEPQAIFETLNAHGTPLLPADLIKNWLLWEGTRQSLKTDTLYLEYWRPFDREINHWRAITGVGHAARARVDTFLQNWLMRYVHEPIPAKHLYDRFLRHVAAGGPRNDHGKLDVQALMASISLDAERFRLIEEPVGKTRFHVFLRRLKVIDIVVFHPLLLELMGRPGSDDDDRDIAGTALESYLVRRIICGGQTRGYGVLALSLLERVAKLPAAEPAAPTIVKGLAGASDKLDQWPDDPTLLAEWKRKKFYGNLRRNRVLMILRAIEEQYLRDACGKSEPVLTFNFDDLEIEHILPQTWETHWPLPDDVTRDDRNWALHGIGNLTLVTGSLNKALSHGPWFAEEGAPSKRRGIDLHSKLDLNARLLREHPMVWNEAAMKVRAESLFSVARRIWPAPVDLLADLESPETAVDELAAAVPTQIAVGS
jgi:hypothetical protein